MSREQIEIPREAARSREAADWWVRHESDTELSPSAAQAWNDWIGDPGNSAAYDGMVDSVRLLQNMPPPALRSVAEIRAHCGVRMSKPRRRSGWGLAAAVTLLVGASSAVWVFERWSQTPEAVAHGDYATERAGQRTLHLRDGSTVTLAADSRVQVRYTEARRTLILERGEALFQARRDPARPFEVLAGHGRITALGTQFDVRLSASQIKVAVTEGTVEVAPRERKANDEVQWIPLRVARGQEMSYGPKGDASAPRPVDVSSAAAWVGGSIEYRGRALKDVVEDVQRYTQQRVRVDPTASDLQFSGIFVERDADQWIRLLPRALPVDVITRSDEVLIKSRE